MTDLPTVALSILQPWAWLIVNGYKDIENRSWRTHRRGPILIHTGKGFDRDAHRDLIQGLFPGTQKIIRPDIARAYKAAWQAGEVHRGGVVGLAAIDDCVEDHESDWFFGDFGFVLTDRLPLPFMPMTGARGFFPATYQDRGPPSSRAGSPDDGH